MQARGVMWDAKVAHAESRRDHPVTRKAGMKKSTFYRRLSRNDWTLLELLRIDRYIHLTGEDAAGLREWFNGGITKGP